MDKNYKELIFRGDTEHFVAYRARRRRVKALRKERDEPRGKVQIDQLLAPRASRQQGIDDKRKANMRANHQRMARTG